MLRTCVLAVLLSLFTGPVQALRFDWTPEEKACAATLGIDLEKPPSPNDSCLIEDLAWRSDFVAVGTVTEIRTDEGAAYPTLATIEVSDFRKGDVGARTITLCLESGPLEAGANGGQLYVSVSHEPTVGLGERLVLFLSTTYQIPEDDPTRYVLLPGQYRWFHDYKFIVRDSRVTLPPYTNWSMSLEDLLQRVDESVRLQASRCERSGD